MKNSLVSIVASSFLMISISGCGGGGSNSSSNTSSSGNVAFPANAVVAEATSDNADKVAKTVVVNPNSSLSNLGLNSVSSEVTVSNIQLLKQSTNILNKSIQSSSLEENTALNETINQTVQCSDGGSMTISGVGSDATGGTVTTEYKNCQEYSTTKNGKMQSVISDYNSKADDYSTIKITFLTDFSVSTSSSSDNFNFTYKTGSYINEKINTFDDYGSASDMSIETSYIITMNEKKFGLKNCKFNLKYTNNSNDLEYTQSQGRIYINNDLTAYVDVDTSYNPPVKYIYQYGELASGKGHYLMANNTPLTITATGSGNYDTTIGNN